MADVTDTTEATQATEEQVPSPGSYDRFGPDTVSEEVVLDVKDLRTYFTTRWGTVKAVDGVSFSLRHGETLGLVGESACGKSVTALSIMRLIPSPPGHIVGGEVVLNGRDILPLPERQMTEVRGGEVSMILQDPMTALNPVFSVENQVGEAIAIHQKLKGDSLWRRIVHALQQVRIPAPETRAKDYPHQLSGGMRQRVVGAIGISTEPSVLIADEPTTSLDVTIQAQILELMKDLTSETGTALMIITHNLGVVARYADRVNVMYAGKMRETGPAEDLYESPAHPYTVGLLRSVPRLDEPTGVRLEPIEGEIPDPGRLPAGCAFTPRCRWAVERCSTEEPGLLDAEPGRQSACWERERLRDASGVAE